MPDVTTAVALSMYSDGIPLDQITEATDLTVEQLADAVAEHFDVDAPILTHPTDDGQDHGQEQGGAVTPQLPEQLLAWAEQHAHPRIRDLAAQARTALDELARLHGTEHDRAQAQTEVDRLRAALADAEQRLHALQPAPAAAPAPLASVPAPRTAGKRTMTAGRIEQPADKRVRQAIRAWANEHGHTVAPQGLISQDVLRAYTDAHQSGLAKAG